MLPRSLLTIFLLATPFGCVSAPPAKYTDQPEVVARRDTLQQRLLALLPKEKQPLPSAREEALWLADTAHKASAAIARYNAPLFQCWLNNRMVNSLFSIRERGLCWHYQHDLYRELRRRPLNHFRLGCCVRDKGNRHEHHGVYIAPSNASWPHGIVCDAWRYQGRLLCLKDDQVIEQKWENEPEVTRQLNASYPEGHSLPLEHWIMVKDDKRLRHYIPYNSPEGQTSRQGQLMRRNIEAGLQQRGGRPYAY